MDQSGVKSVIVMTGTSGAGKGTLEKPLMERIPELELAVSATTRARRPSFDELERRLRERATESEGEIGERLARAREQLAQADEFDHVIVNDDLDRAVEELTGIVRRALGSAATMRS